MKLTELVNFGASIAIIFLAHLHAGAIKATARKCFTVWIQGFGVITGCNYVLAQCLADHIATYLNINGNRPKCANSFPFQIATAILEQFRGVNQVRLVAWFCKKSGTGRKTKGYYCHNCGQFDVTQHKPFEES